MNQANFVEISSNYLISIVDDLVSFDVFVKINGTYQKVISKGMVVSEKLLDGLFDKGYLRFFLSHEELEDYKLVNYKLSEMISQSIEAKKFSEIFDYIIKYSNRVMDQIYMSLKVDTHIFIEAKSLIEDVLHSVFQDVDGLLKVFRTASRHPHMVHHSIEVAFLSVLLAQKAEIESDSILKQIALGGLIHDSGIGELTYNPECKEELTPSEKKELYRHPQIGKSLVDRLKNISPVVQDIILQHHERPNGHGYPNSLRGHEITKPAKIVAITDTFAAMRHKRAYRGAFSVKESIERMKSDVGKFDSDLLKQFIGLF